MLAISLLNKYFHTFNTKDTIGKYFFFILTNYNSVERNKILNPNLCFKPSKKYLCLIRSTENSTFDNFENINEILN